MTTTLNEDTAAVLTSGGVCAPMSITYRVATQPTRSTSPWSRHARRIDLRDGPGEQGRLDALGAAVEGMRRGERPPTVQVPYSMWEDVGLIRADRGGIRYIQPPAAAR